MTCAKLMIEKCYKRNIIYKFFDLLSNQNFDKDQGGQNNL